MSLHISSSASFINTTCLLASSSVCHDALRMLWTSCAKLTLAAFPSPSLKTVLHIFLFFRYHQSAAKACSWKQTSSQMYVRCVRPVCFCPLANVQKFWESIAFDIKINLCTFFARGCKQRATCDVRSSVEFRMIDNASLLHRPRQRNLKI